MEEVSKYKVNSVASKKKHIYSRLLDYFSVFVISYIVFVVVYAIGARLPHYVALNKEYEADGIKALQYIGDTHLRHYDEEHQGLVEQDQEAIEYLTTLTKTSAYVYGKTYPVKQDDGTYIETVVERKDTFIADEGVYSLNNISYYFKIFKKTEATLNDYVYDGVDYKNDVNTYLYSKVMGLNPNDFITADDPNYIARGEGVPQYLILSDANTTRMINRLAKGETIDENAVAIYNKLTGVYGNTIQYGIDEIENKSDIYKGIIANFDNTYQKIALHIFLMYLISYTLGYVGLIVVMRIIGKEWVTLGQKVLNLAMCCTNDMEVGTIRLICYHLINYLLCITSSLLGFYLIGMFGVFSLQVFPHINLLAIMLALLTLTVISLFIPFFKGNYDLSTLITRISLRDKNEYDAPIEFDEISDEEFKELEKKDHGEN